MRRATVRSLIKLSVVTQSIDFHQVYVIWLSQFVVLSASMTLCFAIGTSLWFGLTGGFVFTLLCGLLGFCLHRSAASKALELEKTWLKRLMKSGVWATLLLFALLAPSAIY